MIEILTYANASGALCATKRGAIPAMPGEQDIQECMRATIRLVRLPVEA